VSKNRSAPNHLGRRPCGPKAQQYRPIPSSLCVLCALCSPRWILCKRQRSEFNWGER